jgi:hypothetical protein
MVFLENWRKYPSSKSNLDQEFAWNKYKEANTQKVIVTSATFGASLMISKTTSPSQPIGLYPEIYLNRSAYILCFIQSIRSVYKLGKASGPYSWLNFESYLPCLLLFPQEAPWQLILPNDGSLTDSFLCPQGPSHSKNSMDGFAAGIFSNARKASDSVGCSEGYC